MNTESTTWVVRLTAHEAALAGAIRTAGEVETVELTVRIEPAPNEAGAGWMAFSSVSQLGGEGETPLEAACDLLRQMARAGGGA